MYCLRRLCKFLLRHHLIMFYYAAIRNPIEYAAPAYHGCRANKLLDHNTGKMSQDNMRQEMCMCSLSITGTSLEDCHKETLKKHNGRSRTPTSINCASTASVWTSLYTPFCKTTRRLKTFIMTASSLFDEEHHL